MLFNSCSHLLKPRLSVDALKICFASLILLYTIASGHTWAAASPGDVISNQAEISYIENGLTVVNRSNIDSFPVVAFNSADLALTVQQANIYADDTVRVAISITNTGATVLANGELTLQLPADTTLTETGGLTVTDVTGISHITLPDIRPLGTLDLLLDIALPGSLAPGVSSIPLEYSANGVSINSANIDMDIRQRTVAQTNAMYYQQGGPNPPLQVPVTQYDMGSGSYADIPAPLIPASTDQVTDRPLSLTVTDAFRRKDTIFYRVKDADHNKDDNVVDLVRITLNVTQAGSTTVLDSEGLLLKETGPATGLFLGYIQTVAQTPILNDGELAVDAGYTVHMTYLDDDDLTLSNQTISLIDPYGVVFDSRTGLALDGVTVSLINTATGGPAEVFGDDGMSHYPSTLVTGSTVTDSSGTEYVMLEGGYRFPLISPGSYRLEITLPNGSAYTWPSVVSTADIQTLPNAPFTIVTGSRGELFTLLPGPPLNVDIPIDMIDMPIRVKKRAGKDTVASGDYLQYRVDVQNVSTLAPLNETELTDILPHGFRYEKGSAHLDDNKMADPTISKDGRTLIFPIGMLAANESKTVSYVTRVGAVRQSEATNSAYALANGGAVGSNVARITVKIKQDFMLSHSVVMGRVADIEEDPKSNGIPGVRIFMEDGTYVLTDKKGMYHFEGVKPGTHLLQIDTDTLPEQYELIDSTEKGHLAQSGWSRFIEIAGGSVWRVNYDLRRKAAPQGSIALSLDNRKESGDGALLYELEIRNKAVPVNNARLMVVIPEAGEYVTGSSRVDGKQYNDPQINANILTWRLGNLAANQTRKIELVAHANGKALLSKATLLFDTPSKRDERIPLIENLLTHANCCNRTHQARRFDDIATFGQRPGDTTAKKTKTIQKKRSKPVYDKEWVNNLPPGFEWLSPLDGALPATPAIEVAIKHAVDQRVKVHLNGKPVPKVNFEFSRKNKSKTAAFSLWRGIDLVEGDNRVELILTDLNGKEVARHARTVHFSGPPVKAGLIEERSYLLADGSTPPVIAIRLTDADGAPARRDGRGEVQISAPYNVQPKTEYNRTLMPGAPQERNYYTIGENGIALITLQPTTEAGEVNLTLPLVSGKQQISAQLLPAMRDWILVGLAEGTAGYNTINNSAEPLTGSEAEEGLYFDDRIAFYAKGRIKGDWLMTIAYDSTKKRRNELKQATIDPGAYYTLYGDKSQQRNDAQSSEKLYLKIERNNFYALFGDYDTGLTKTELSNYSQSLTGLKSHYRGEKYEVVLFASESDHAYAKDEFRGKGITGPYPLSRKNIVLNSEKVVIERRDRFKSERLINKQTLSRHIDYDINYDTGTITFFEPVMHRDPDLNPIYIVIKYESFDESDRELTAGGHVQVKLNEQLKLGLSHISEGEVGNTARLNGIDATYALTGNTTIRVEAAMSETNGRDENREGTAYLAELEHRSKRVDGRLYIREQEREFGLAQTTGSESGTRKLGAEGIYHTTDRLDLKANIVKESNLTTRAKRDVAEAGVVYKADSTQYRGGVKSVKDTMGDKSKRDSNLLTAGVSHNMLDGKLTLKLDHDQALDNAESLDYPTRTKMGADYRLNKHFTLFGLHEWSQGEEQDTQDTRLGLKRTLWKGAKAFTSLSHKQSQHSKKSRAGYGLQQKWKINDQWSLDGSFEQSKTLSSHTTAPVNMNSAASSGSDDDFTATSLAATYNPGDWIWMARVENRDASHDDIWNLATSIQSQPKANLGLLTSLSMNKKTTDNGQNSQKSDLRLGIVYRPPGSRWLLLDKLDLIHEESSGTDFDSSSWRIVNNLNANYRLSAAWQTSFQHGGKYVKERIDGRDYSGYTNLFGFETRYNFSRSWDVGARASVLNAYELKQQQYSIGASIGHRANEDIWVSIGYNIIGFEDSDFSKSNYTSEGVFVQFRMKFDQQSMKSAMDWLGQ